MRPIEQKMAWQRAVMLEAERWLDEPPWWVAYCPSVPEYYPNSWSVWRRRSIKRKALERAWREKWGSACF